jgi:septum formation protein
MLILASQSHIRSTLLTHAGVAHQVLSSPFEEEKAQRELIHLNPLELAQKLAILKASALSSIHAGALVIGADQTLNFNGTCLHKSPTIAAARATLQKLRGQTHDLHSAVCCCMDGKILFQHVETVRLTMADFSDSTLERYLTEVGDGLLSSVGCYQIEAEGIRLFDDIDGDHFSILGLPLLPLLVFLRKIGELPT